MRLCLPAGRVSGRAQATQVTPRGWGCGVLAPTACPSAPLPAAGGGLPIFVMEDYGLAATYGIRNWCPLQAGGADGPLWLVPSPGVPMAPGRGLGPGCAQGPLRATPATEMGRHRPFRSCGVSQGPWPLSALLSGNRRRIWVVGRGAWVAKALPGCRHVLTVGTCPLPCVLEPGVLPHLPWSSLHGPHVCRLGARGGIRETVRLAGRGARVTQGGWSWLVWRSKAQWTARDQVQGDRADQVKSGAKYEDRGHRKCGGGQLGTAPGSAMWQFCRGLANPGPGHRSHGPLGTEERETTPQPWAVGPPMLRAALVRAGGLTERATPGAGWVTGAHG